MKEITSELDNILIKNSDLRKVIFICFVKNTANVVIRPKYNGAKIV